MPHMAAKVNMLIYTDVDPVSEYRPKRSRGGRGVKNTPVIKLVGVSSLH